MSLEARYTRRRFLEWLGATILAKPLFAGVRTMSQQEVASQEGGTPSGKPDSTATTAFLCGDIMVGRGIDQVLPHPVPPRLHEAYVKDAREYVVLAERANAAIPRPAAFDYIWGAALAELERAAPDVRIANLETAVTTHEEWWTDKSIHYRMNPANLPCLQAARLHCCVLANNHVLD